MTYRKQASVVTTIDQFLAQINSLSQRTKAAEEPPTSHPSGDVDDRTQPAETGSRAAEHDRDIREANGPAAVTEDLQIPDGPAAPDKGTGVEQSLTGEDPSVETESVNTCKEDPGENAGDEGRGATEHPADLSNADINEKYSAVCRALEQIKAAAQPGDVLTKNIEEGTTALFRELYAAEAYAKAAAAGQNMADVTVAPSQVAAGQQRVMASIASTVHDARQLAEKTAAYLSQWQHSLQKAAEEQSSPASHGASQANGDSELSEEEANDALAALQSEQTPEDAALIEALLAAAGSGGTAAESPTELPAEDVLASLKPEDVAMLEQALASEGVSLEQLASGLEEKTAACKGKPTKPTGGWRPKTAAEAARLRALTKAVRDLCRT